MADVTVLKGFPTEVSEYIDLPDIGELILYPSFFDIRIEDAYKYGTEFQKYLFDKVPLRHDKKHISVLWQVRLLTPRTRSCTGVPKNGDSSREWHIDCEEEKEHIYARETDRVHLLTNKVTSPTEFLEEEVVVDKSPSTPYAEFIEYFHNNIHKFNVKPKAMEHNRIVTFTNHMHRATASKRPEFKFMMRLVETDREREPAEYHPKLHNQVDVFDADREGYVTHLVREPGKITIYLPSINSDMLWKKE